MSKGLGFTAIPDAQQKCYWSPTSFVSCSNLLLTGMRTAVSCTSPGQEGDRAGQRDLLAQHGFHRHQVEHLCSVSICCSLCWYQCWGQSILQIRRAQWQKQIAHHLGMHSYTAQTVFLKYSVIAQYPPSEESKAWITANLSLPVNLEKLKRWIIIPHVEKLKEGLLSPTYRPRRKSRLRLQLHHVLDHALGDMRIRGDVGTQLRLPESNHVNQPQMLPPPPKLHNRLVRRTLLHQASCSLSCHLQQFCSPLEEIPNDFDKMDRLFFCLPWNYFRKEQAQHSRCTPFYSSRNKQWELYRLTALVYMHTFFCRTTVSRILENTGKTLSFAQNMKHLVTAKEIFAKSP